MNERAVAVQSEIEFRSTDTGHQFTGYAAVFGRDSAPIGGRYIEQVAPLAFANTLARPNRKTFVRDHDDKLLLASTQSGHLRLSADSQGLLTDASMADTTYTRDLRELHDRGELSGMSFEFGVDKGGVVWSDDAKRRTLTSVRLYHVTVLAGLSPAYADTTAAIRSAAEALDADETDLLMLVDALREERRLTEPEHALFARMLVALAPEPAIAPVLVRVNLDKARALLRS